MKIELCFWKYSLLKSSLLFVSGPQNWKNWVWSWGLLWNFCRILLKVSSQNTTVHRISRCFRILCSKLSQHIQTTSCVEFLILFKTEFWAFHCKICLSLEKVSGAGLCRQCFWGYYRFGVVTSRRWTGLRRVAGGGRWGQSPNSKSCTENF